VIPRNRPQQRTIKSVRDDEKMYKETNVRRTRRRGAFA